VVTGLVIGLVTELVTGPVPGLVPGLVPGAVVSAVDSWMCGEFALTDLVAFSNKGLCSAWVSCGARAARGCVLASVLAGAVLGESALQTVWSKNSAIKLYRHA